MTRLRIARRLPATLVGLGMAVTLGLTGCTSSPPTTTADSTRAPVAAAPATAGATLALQPGGGTQNFAPGDPVKVTVANGEIQSVALTNADGKQVAGQLSADKHTWTTTESLGYGKTYTWSGAATGSDGKQVPLAGSFSTVTPKRQLAASLNVGDGQTYGIAMPIALTFSSKVTDKAAAERALSVETTPNTAGSWAWLSDTQVHWRPAQYYQPGTKVTVHANIYGVQVGAGTYGKADVTSTFTIGRSEVVKGDTTTHRLQVIRDGAQIADFPASYGLDSDPGRVTHSGTHVVMETHPTYSMSNPRYGYTDVNVPWAVRISNNGEFIHGLAGSVWAQGKKNVSHGCVNLSPANAKIFYDQTMIGDPVEITGSTQQLSAQDGDYSDWTYSWGDWAKLSALSS